MLFTHMAWTQRVEGRDILVSKRIEFFPLFGHMRQNGAHLIVKGNSELLGTGLTLTRHSPLLAFC